jgi:hypothetical protein
MSKPMAAIQPEYRSRAEHRATLEAFDGLPLGVQRKTDFRSFDTGFHAARGAVTHRSEQEIESTWRRIVKRVRGK